MPTYLLLDQLRTPLLLEVLAGQPEEDVLLRVLAPQERPEDHAALCEQTRKEGRNITLCMHGRAGCSSPSLLAKFPIHC